MAGTRGEHAGRALAQRSTLRQRQKDATRARIVDEAVDIFAAEGFQAANIDAIARAAGIARTTFYLHFKTKIDLANAIAEPLRPVFEDVFSELGRRALTTEDVGAWLGDYLLLTREHTTRVAVATQANVSDPALGRDLTLINESNAALVADVLLDGADPTARELARLNLMLLSLERYAFLAEVQHAVVSRELRAAMVDHVLEVIRPIRQRVQSAPA